MIIKNKIKWRKCNKYYLKNVRLKIDLANLKRRNRAGKLVNI